MQKVQGLVYAFNLNFINSNLMNKFMSIVLFLALMLIVFCIVFGYVITSSIF